jgi:hypothetical protein
MVRKRRLENVGEQPADESTVLGGASDASIASETSNTEEATQEGGFAPGTLEQINSDMSESTQVVGNTAQSAPTAPVTPVSNGSNEGDDDDTDRAKRREKNALLREVGKIGEQYGAGKTSMISLAEAVVEAAQAKTIGPNDADEIYQRFKKGADAKAVLDDAGIIPDEATVEKSAIVTEDKSKTQQTSKLRTFIKLGNQYEDEASDLIRRARNAHLEMLKGDRKLVMAGSTYTVLNGVAAQHIGEKGKARNNTIMDDGELRSFMSVEPRDTKVKDSAQKLLDALVTAEAARRGSDERAAITSSHLDDAIESMRMAFGDIEHGEGLKTLDEYDAKIAKREKDAQDKADRKAQAEAEKAAKANAAKATPAAQGAAQSA